MIFAGKLRTWLQTRATNAGKSAQVALQDLASMLFLDADMLATVRHHAPDSLGLVQGAAAAHQDARRYLAAWQASPHEGVRALLGATRHFRRHEQNLNKRLDQLIELGLSLFSPLRESVGRQLSQAINGLHGAEAGWGDNEERSRYLDETKRVWEVLNTVTSPSIHDLLTLDSLCHSIQMLNQQADSLRHRRNRLAMCRSRLKGRTNARDRKIGSAYRILSQFPDVFWGSLPEDLEMATARLTLSEVQFHAHMQEGEWDAAESAYARIGEALESIDAICSAISRQSPKESARQRVANGPTVRPVKPQLPSAAQPKPNDATSRSPQTTPTIQPQQPETTHPAPQSEAISAALETLRQLGRTVKGLGRQCLLKSWSGLTAHTEDATEFIDDCREFLESGAHCISDAQLSQQLANISEWCATLQRALDNDHYEQAVALEPIKKVKGF